MQLTGDNACKIVLGNSAEDYATLLRLKAQLKDRFYVRNVDNKLDNGFLVGLFKEDIGLIDHDLQDIVEPMSDEGIERICVSSLYRFIPEQYIDDFVRRGRIWLSTFDRCQRLEDENRTDGNEGRVEFYHDTQKIAHAHVGKNGYLLCASTTPFASGSKPNQRCIYIQDLPGLVNAVNKALRGKKIKVSAVLQGPCIYTDHRVHLDYDPDRTPEELEKVLTAFGDRVYFLKDALPQFVVEHEYRVVWLTDGEIKGDGLLVQIDNPEYYVQAIMVPQYSSMFRPPVVAANNCPYVIPLKMVTDSIDGKVKIV